MCMSNDAQLKTIQRMLQLVLDAICSLAEKITGEAMLLGEFNGDSIGAGPRSPSVKWVKKILAPRLRNLLSPTVSA